MNAQLIALAVLSGGGGGVAGAIAVTFAIGRWRARRVQKAHDWAVAQMPPDLREQYTRGRS